MEAVLKIHDVKVGDKVYKNIYPKKELDVKDYIIVEKIYEDITPRDGKFGESYNCSVKYLGEVVSFFLTKPEYTEMQATCPLVGTRMRLTYAQKVATYRVEGKVQERKYLGLKITNEDETEMLDEE